MTRQIPPPLVVAPLAALGVVIAVAWWNTRSSTPPPPPSEPLAADVPSRTPPPEPTDEFPPVLAAAVEKLTARGWDERTAKAVVDHNREWLLGVFDADREAYDRTLILLGQMPDADRLQPVLAARPELVGLLLLVPDPSALAAELEGPDADLLTDLFLLHLDRASARSLAEALPGNARLITDLYRRGVAGAEAAFLFDRTTPGAREYETWLRDTLRMAVSQTDEELAGLFHLVIEDGPDIRRRMDDRDDFRVRFPGLWSKLVRVARHRNEDLGGYVGQPGLWEFLAGADAEKLMADWGALPADLLHGDPAGRYPPETHPRVRQLLRGGDPALADLLLLCRGEPTFVSFLKRDLPDDLLRGVADDLFKPENSGRLRPRLELLQRKLEVSPDHLAEAVGRRPPGVREYVPFYSVYKVYQSYADGDDPSALDLAFAAADLATVAIPAGKLVVVAGKQGTQVLGKRAAQEAVKKMVVTEAEQAVRQRVGRDASARFGAIVANRFAVGVAARRLFAQAIGRLRAELARGRLRIETKIDVTGAFEYVYRRTGRDPFRPLTGLEPKVFISGETRLELRLCWSSDIIRQRQKALDALRKFVDRLATPIEPTGRPEPLPPGGFRTGPTAPPLRTTRLGAALSLAAAADLLAPAVTQPHP